MAKIGCKPNISATITLHLSEEEAGALDALVGYGFKPFIEAFYKHLGKAYLEPYEAGLRSLFESVRGGDASVHSFLEKAREARAVFDGRRVSSEPPKYTQTRSGPLCAPRGKPGMTCHACGKPIGWWASWFAPESWCERCEYIFCVHRRCHHGPFQGDLGWTDCQGGTE